MADLLADKHKNRFEPTLREHVSKKCNDTILITGSARSGTSILGKLIYSMKNVEYDFEPPGLVSLFSQINNINESQWKFFFESYIYESFLINSIAGRTINLNPNDDSSIIIAKSKNEINNRLYKSFTKLELEKEIINRIPLIKIPSLIPFLDLFNNYFPNIKIIYLNRNPIDCINSMLDKNWFSSFSLNAENRIWPTFRYYNELIPFWVAPDDFEHWITLNEYDRCAYYFLKMTKKINLKNLIEINYDNLISHPNYVIEQLVTRLNLERGEKTQLIIESINKTKKKRDLEIIKKMTPFYQEQLTAFHNE